MSLLLAVATAHAIQSSLGFCCDLRWPNDVLIDEHKVAGILPQLVESCIIAGIGINVNNTAFDEGLRTPATSLKIAMGGCDVSREVLLVNLLQKLHHFSHLLVQDGPQSILDAFTEASTYVVNRKVVIEDSGVIGTTAGLDENGFLLIRSKEGQLERVAAGGVRPAA